MTMPKSLGPIHFVGIGGIGMCGIAEIMNHSGYTVRGSDLSYNANIQRLEHQGISVAIGHQPEYVHGATVVVISSAVKEDNPEVQEALRTRIPVISRAEMLAELMRLRSCIVVAGTHGKTTTTSLVACVLEKGKFDPTVINGGVINAYGTNARFGKGEWMVVEGDESDGSFLRLPADINIVTNIDQEHLDHYKHFSAIKAGFLKFLESVPFYGFSVVCIDHPVVCKLAKKLIHHKRILTYGCSPSAQVRLVSMCIEDAQTRFTVDFSKLPRALEKKAYEFTLPMLGEHNVMNSLAAITVGVQLGVRVRTIQQALTGFKGVKRRFQLTGKCGNVCIYDDYGHHPIEIQAVLKSIQSAKRGRIIAVIEPHRYSRVQNLFEEFVRCVKIADYVLLLPIYPAGESEIEGVSSERLAQAIKQSGYSCVKYVNNQEELLDVLASYINDGDLIVCLGAGSITLVAHWLPGALTERLKANTMDSVL